MQNSLRIKYNGSTVHIDGLGARTTGGGEDKGDHISYYAQNACATLTRSGSRMATSRTEGIESPEQALKAAKGLAVSLRKKVCKSCEAAALALIEEPTGKTYRFLVSLDEETGETTTVEITAGTRAEAKAMARKTPGALRVVSLN